VNARRVLAALVLLGALPPAELRAQAVDTAAAVQALAHFDARCDAAGRALWGRPLCGPLLLVHAPTRTAVANAPDDGGVFRSHAGAWVGTLPEGVPTANTVVEWAGRRWAMVLLPLPADAFARTSLLAHEAFHRVQPELGLEAHDAAGAHLETAAGRTWLRMELRALADALRDTTPATRRAVDDALRFRAHRYRLFPGADSVEALLERHEGLAEYTGVRVAMDELQAGAEPVLRALRDFDARPAYARAFAYATGPAIGLLLDRLDPAWRRDAARLSMGALLERAAGTPADLGDAAALAEAAERYGYADVAAAEAERAAAAEARLADIRARLLDGPVLLLRQDALNAAFDPGALLPLPAGGTFYPTGSFQADWGRLHVEAGGAVLAADWRTLRLSAAGLRHDAAARTVQGVGWRLDLADGWTLRRLDDAGSWQGVRAK
jgi:hypothetical protein